jgi:hypothetical protein
VDEYGLRTLLRDLAQTEIPPARVDLDQAMVAGQRQRRITLARIVGSAVAVAAAIAVVAVSGISSPAGSRPKPVVPSAPNHARSRVVAPDQLNPLTPYAAFGWLPAGYLVGTEQALLTTTQNVQLTATQPDGSGQIQLTVNARGACTGSVHTSLTCPGTEGSPSRMRSFEPAPAVNGRPAYWAMDQQVGGYLVWQYAPAAWASLRVFETLSPRLPPTKDWAMLERVARRVRYDVGTPLTIAFWLRLPAGWAAGSAMYTDGPSGTLLGSSIQVGPPGDPLAADLVATPGRPGQAGRCKGAPNTTLDGAPATRQEPGGLDATYQDLCAAYVDGLSVYVAVDLTSPDGQPVLRGGALGLAEDLHLLGASVSDWTTRPLR